MGYIGQNENLKELKDLKQRQRNRLVALPRRVWVGVRERERGERERRERERGKRGDDPLALHAPPDQAI